ncbi:MAG: HDOD domain-containing protein [Chlorobi bacterium]|nr:HDOD domain-containing protein [Chlorobiota bacterium]
MNIVEHLQQTHEFASLPTVAARLLSMLEDDQIDIRTIAQFVEQDVAIAAKVIRVANSPIFGLRVPVASISQAIMTIGLNRVSNIVLGVSIYSKFILLRTLAGDYLQKFWMHSAVAATLARSLARYVRCDFQELEFLTALVHDIGKLAMLQLDPERFGLVHQAIDAGIDELESERQYFDAAHTEVGEVIANLWKLPPQVQVAIKLHHENQLHNDELSPLLSVVRVADLAAESYGFTSGEKIDKPIHETIHWKKLESISPQPFDPEQIDVIFQNDIASAHTLIEALTIN